MTTRIGMDASLPSLWLNGVRMMAVRFEAFAVLAFSSVLLLGAGGARVPSAMLGTWANGACSERSNRLVITAHTAALGLGKPAAIYYDADDGGPHAAIHWNEEYVVDNFVYVKESRAIVHNGQGFGMPGAVLYKRCAAKRTP